MKFNWPVRLFFSMVLSLSISHIPYAAAQMISTGDAAAQLNRSRVQENAQRFLSRDDVKKELEKFGLSAGEISQRVASMSDQELKQLSGQIDKVQAGGDVIVIGIGTLLLIIIIILLVR